MKTPFQEKFLLFTIRSKKDPQAYAALYDKYVQEVYRFVFFKVSSKELAEDITSDVFLQVWQYLIQSSDPVRSFRGLLYKVARNKIIDTYRSRATAQHVRVEDIPEIADDANLEQSVQSKQLADEAIDLIKQLKQDYQEVLLFRLLEEKSIKEIAEIMGKTQTSVRVMLHRALKKIESLKK